MLGRFVAVSAIIVAVSAVLSLDGPATAQSKNDAMRLHKQAYVLQEKAQSNEDLKKALQNLEEALTIYGRVGDPKRSAYVYNSAGIIYFRLAQYDKAREYFDKSLELSRKIGEVNAEGLTLNNLGLLYSHWGQYAKSAEYYEQSVAICRKLRDIKGEGQTLNNLGSVYKDRGQHAKAVEYYEKSLQIKRKVGDTKGQASTLNNLGLVYTGWGQYAKALEYYETSLKLSRKLRDVKGEANTLNNLGLVYSDKGQYDKAVEYYDNSLELKRKLRDLSGEANTLNNLGIVYKDLGQYDKALKYYENSLELSRKLGDSKGETNTLGNVGSLYWHWGQYPNALEFYTRQLEIARKVGDPKGESRAMQGLGLLYKYWGQYGKATECYERSLELSRKLGDLKAEGQTLNSLGTVYEHFGDYQKALANFRKGLEIFQRIGVSGDWAESNIGNLFLDISDVHQAESFLKQSSNYASLGRLSLAKSEYSKAKAFYEKLLDSAEKSRKADDLFAAATGLGLACEGLKDDNAAADYFRRALNHVEEMRSSLAADQREQFFDVKVNGFYRTAPYEGLARVQMRMNKATEAWNTSEYSKARLFAEAMSRRTAGATFDLPKALQDTDQVLMDQLSALKKQRQAAYEKDNNDRISELEPRIRQLEEQFAAHKKMVREKFPLFAATKYPEPMDLSQTDLKDNERVLTYHVTDPGLIIYFTKGNSIVKAVLKPVSRKEIGNLVLKFRASFEVGGQAVSPESLANFDFTCGRQLADLLLSDILPDLPKDAQLLIVPDGPLGVVPFEMLVLNQGGKVGTYKTIPYVTGAEFFGERNPISYYQSVTALTLARTLGKHQKTVAGPWQWLIRSFPPRMAA